MVLVASLLNGCGGAMHAVDLDPPPKFNGNQRVQVWSGLELDTLIAVRVSRDSLWGTRLNGGENRRIAIATSAVDSIRTASYGESVWAVGGAILLATGLLMRSALAGMR